MWRCVVCDESKQLGAGGWGRKISTASLSGDSLKDYCSFLKGKEKALIGVEGEARVGVDATVVTGVVQGSDRPVTSACMPGEFRDLCCSRYTSASHWTNLALVWIFGVWRPGWPGTCWDPPASLQSQGLGFQAYTSNNQLR